MEFSWLLVCQEDTGMVVKFDNDYRALYPVVERICIAKSPDPGEVGLH